MSFVAHWAFGMLGACLFHIFKRDQRHDRWDFVSVIVIGLIVAAIMTLIKDIA